MREVSLRTRVSRLLIVFGFGITLVVVLVSWFVNERLERSVWHAMLNSAASQLTTTRVARATSASSAQANGQLRVYSRGRPSTSADDVPASLSPLQPGFHDEIMLDGDEHTVLVVDTAGERRYLSYDTSINEGLEQSVWNQVMLFGVLLGIAIWLVARIVAARAAHSVLDLAASVRGLSATDRVPKLDKTYPVTEVTDIAASIDGLLERIGGFVERERAFANAVSHELTTPIAVISGAVDVLQNGPPLPAQSAAPLQRIAATARSMNDVLKALLFLAREPHPVSNTDGAPWRLDRLLAQLIESHAADYPERGEALRILRADPVLVSVPQSAATIVLNNLIRNALQHSMADTIDIRLTSDRISIRDNGRGMTPEAISRAYTRRARAGAADTGGGLGLSIVQRVCNHIGWQLAIESSDGSGTSITVAFGTTAVATPRGTARASH